MVYFLTKQRNSTMKLSFGTVVHRDEFHSSVKRLHDQQVEILTGLQRAFHVMPTPRNLERLEAFKHSL